MGQFNQTLRLIIGAALRVSWGVATAALLGHFFISWLALIAAGETFAASPAEMIYFYFTTGTTVGYGDLSPETDIGRLMAVLWIMPGAIAGVGWLLLKVSAAATTMQRKAATGMASFQARKGHNVFIGYLQGQTETLIEETTAGEAPSVLVTVRDLEGRVPGGLDWVRTDVLSSQDALQRAGVQGAGRVVVMTGDDEITTTICLALAGDFPDVTVVALFNERHKAQLIGKACPSIRCVVAPASLLLARAACSNHAERVVDVLLSSRVDATLRTAVFSGAPSGGFSFRELQRSITHFTDAVAIGVTHLETGEMDLAPARGLYIHGGTLIHFIGDRDFASFDHDGRGVQK